MTLPTWTQTHRRSILFLMLLLALAGIATSFRLPVSLFPTVEFPRVVVALDSGDQPAEQMEIQVTRPVEEVVRRVPGVRNVRSNTSRGSAEISINFDWGRDMPAAALQINAAIAQITSQLPAGTQVTTRQMDPTVFPILAYSLTSGRLSPSDLHDLAQYQLRPALSGVTGVSRVQVLGGAIDEVRVDVNLQKLRAANLVIDDIGKALAAANVITAVGRLEDHYKLFLVVSDTRLQNLQQIRDVVIKSGALGIVRLRDVASVEHGTTPAWTRVTADGHNAVLFQVYQQPGSNSVQIVKDVKAALSAYTPQLPEGVTIASWYDQSELVLASASSVRDAVLIGVLLSAVVLMLFLRNWKITLIAIMVVPTVLATAALMLSVLNMSFNIMTLGGMAAAVGLIIDDAIVMIEHIMRRTAGGAMQVTVMAATREFVRPLAGSSGSTLIIFVPLAFLTGVTGAFFKALSLTMAASLLISFLVTWLAVPLLADRFLKTSAQAPHVAGRWTQWCHRRYRQSMTHLLATPWLLLLGVLPLLIAGYLAFNAVGSGFMPSMDEGGFVLDYRSRPGTALSETNRLLQQVEKIITATPDVATYSRRTGTGLGGGLSEANEGDFFVRLKPQPRRPVDAVMEDIRRRIAQEVPGLSIEMAQLMEDLIGDLTAVPQPVEIKVFSDDPAQLMQVANKIASRIGKISGVVDVKNGVNPAGDALNIHIDPVKVALEGMDADSVTKVMNAYLSGTVATSIATGPKMVGVRVWVPQSVRSNTADLRLLEIRAPDGHRFPLGRVVRIETVVGQPQIARENLKRMVAVTARIENRDLGSVIVDVKQIMLQPGLLPKGVTYLLGGLYEQQQIAFKGLIAVFAAAVALVFLLLLFMYESFRLVLSIMITTLLAVSAVFIGLWITHTELNISAMMGMTMIIGMVTEVAIFYFSEQQSLTAEAAEKRGDSGLLASLTDAGVNRMRPIAMTTIAAILTLLPLAFALGEGAEMQQPLAIAIISGLVVQLPLVLLVMPVLYHLMRNRK